MTDIKMQLKAAWYYHKRMEADLEKIEKLRSQAERMTPAYSLTAGSHATASMEDAVSMIADIEAKLDEHAMQMREALKDVQIVIDSLDDYKQRIVLQYRYINFYRWEEIAADLHYSWQGIHKIHAAALRELEKSGWK